MTKKSKAPKVKNQKLNTNAITDTIFRRALSGYLGYSHEGERNLYEVFGYPRIINGHEYRAMYQRNDIASRIVRAFPQATWRDYPCLYDGDKNDENVTKENENSAFVKAWNDLVEKKKVYSYLERADRLSGLGSFSVLLMGFADGLDLDKPLTNQKAELIYLMPYSDVNITISQWNNNEKSERFGLPELYTLQQATVTGKQTTARKSITAHYSRLIHIAEYLEDDEVYGTPRLMSVYNRLKDIEKTVGGSAEMFWLNARNILFGKADSESQLTEAAALAIKEQMDELVHQLRSYIVAQGMEFENFQGAIQDPEPTVTVLLQLIAGAVGIPQRILIGSERGELASDQDENNWMARIDERRVSFAAPFILRPFIEKLILTGNLPIPENEWWIDWKKGAGLSEEKRIDIAVKRTQAISTYFNSPGSETAMTVPELRESVGLDPDVEIEEVELEELPEDEIEEEAENDEMPAPAE